MGQTLAQLDQAAVRYASRAALGPLSLEVQRGDFLGVLGPNGAGKTTLLKALAGLVPLSAGRLVLRGKQYPARATPIGPTGRTSVGVLFRQEEFNLSLPLSVWEVVAFGRTGAAGIGRRLAPADRMAIENALAALGLGAFSARLYRELSDGERQKTQLARLLAQEAELILLDEPTAHLDLDWQERLTELLERLYRGGGGTFVMVTHDVERLPACCNRVLLLKQGRVMAQGPRSEVLRAERLSELYGLEVELVERGRRCAAFGAGVGSPG